MLRTFTAALGLLVCLPIAAAALLIEFAGNVSGLVDPGARLDASVLLDTRVSGRYEVDPTPALGGLPSEVGAARLFFYVGNYAFDATQDPHAITLSNDLGPVPVDIWSTRAFVLPRLEPPIVPEINGVVGYGAGLQLFDGTHSQITGNESVPFVVTDLTGWTIARLFLNALVDDGAGGSGIGPLQIQVDLDRWQVVPEPRSCLLLALGLSFIARRSAAQHQKKSAGSGSRAQRP